MRDPSTSTYSWVLAVVSLFNFKHSDRCVVGSYCDFNLHFPNDLWYWASLHNHLPSGHHLQWSIYSNILPFKKIGSFKNYTLYIFWIQGLYQIYFAVTVFSICSCLFISLIMSFKEQKLYILVSSYLLVYYSVRSWLWFHIKTLCPPQGHKSFMLEVL